MSIQPDNILKAMNPSDRKRLGKAGRTKEEVNKFIQAKNERELQSQIASILRLQRIAFCQPRSDKRSTMTIGWPDFTFALRGYPVAFECKFENGKLSEDQIKCHESMKLNGWHVFIIRTLSEACEIIKSPTLLQSISCKY